MSKSSMRNISNFTSEWLNEAVEMFFRVFTSHPLLQLEICKSNPPFQKYELIVNLKNERDASKIPQYLIIATYQHHSNDCLVGNLVNPKKF